MAILVETSICIPDEKVEAFLKELPKLLEETKNIPGRLAYRGTRGEIIKEEPYVVLQAAAGIPSYEGQTYIILSYWDTVEHATLWEESTSHKEMSTYGTIEIRKYNQVAEPGEREGLHPDRMQRDYFYKVM